MVEAAIFKTRISPYQHLLFLFVVKAIALKQQMPCPININYSSLTAYSLVQVGELLYFERLQQPNIFLSS